MTDREYSPDDAPLFSGYETEDPDSSIVLPFEDGDFDESLRDEMNEQMRLLIQRAAEYLASVGIAPTYSYTDIEIYESLVDDQSWDRQG